MKYRDITVSHSYGLSPRCRDRTWLQYSELLAVTFPDYARVLDRILRCNGKPNIPSQ